ncbi:MAG: hypothetical protein FGM52_09740 [Mycobacterium sp.]|nr:hypothetical protein [Mycobacterium sp.]
MSQEPPPTRFSVEDQWRSFQTFIAAYLVGMLHPRDVFTISPAAAATAPLVEFRYQADGVLRLSIGDRAWSDEPGDFVEIRRTEANEVAASTVELLRGVEGIDGPGALRVSGSGPASTVSVLVKGGFFSGGGPSGVHPARIAAQAARMSADIDVDGDPIEAAARQAGSRAFAATRSGSIAAIAAARELARLRAAFDPFSGTPSSGYLAGGRQ